jgi:transposase-like protein
MFVFEGNGTTAIAVDKHGKTVDFLLRPDHGIAAAQAFFRKALATSLPRWPRKVTLDGKPSSHQALRLLRRENPRWKYVLVRTCQYLNDIIEQDLARSSAAAD